MKRGDFYPQSNPQGRRRRLPGITQLNAWATAPFGRAIRPAIFHLRFAVSFPVGTSRNGRDSGHFRGFQPPRLASCGSGQVGTRSRARSWCGPPDQLQARSHSCLAESPARPRSQVPSREFLHSAVRQTSCCVFRHCRISTRSRRVSCRTLRLRIPCRRAFMALIAFPRSVFGPLDRAHGFQLRISAPCRARRSGVQPLVMAQPQKFVGRVR